MIHTALPSESPLISKAAASQGFHVVSVFVLPVISLLAGIASAFIDPRTEPQKKWLLIALMVLSAAGAVVGSYNDDQKQTASDGLIKQLVEAVQGFGTKQDAFIARLGLPQAATAQFQQSISADSARAAIPTSLLIDQGSSEITVVYYPKHVNIEGSVVINALREGGFKVETRNGNPENANLKSNAIWVGDSVTLEEAKFVTLTLMRAGVSIVSLRKGFKINSEAKKNLIEVGTDPALTGTAPKTAEWVGALTQIPARAATENDLSN